MGVKSFLFRFGVTNELVNLMRSADLIPFFTYINGIFIINSGMPFMSENDDDSTIFWKKNI